MKFWRSILAVGLLVLAFAATAIAYQEAPMFEKLVAEGKLPPVEERLPTNPKVLTPLDSIGRYGGTAHVNSNSQFWLWNGEMVGYEWLLSIEPDLSWGNPNIVESYEFDDDATTLTLHLREGLKWSDGVPFTAEDFIYNGTYVVNNKDLFPSVPDWLTVDGVPLVMSARGDYTVFIDFHKPNSLFLNYISHAWGTQSWQWWFGLFQPAHHAKKFHPAFVGMDELMEQAEAAGYTSWTQYYWDNTGMHFGIQDMANGSPSLAAYVLMERTPEHIVWERNAYYWKVDTAGNQLPYIDRIVLHYVESTDVHDGKIISGEVDASWMMNGIEDLPVYLDNAELGGYAVNLWETSAMSVISVNLTHPDPVKRAIFSDVRFRQALSLALNRDEMNEVLTLGLATPRSFTVPNASPYFKEGFDTSYIDYDPAGAEALLDEIGLDQKNSDGFRLRPDGEVLSITVEGAEVTTGMELIREYWRAVGLDVKIKGVTQDLLNERTAANLVDMMPGGAEFNIDPSFSTLPQYYVPLTHQWPGLWANRYALYYNTDGQEGEVPPPAIQDLFDWYNEIRSAPTIEAKIEPAQKILQSMADNLWQIGLLGAQPWIMIVKDDLMNVPETGLLTWDLTRITPYQTQTWYFEAREAILEPWPGRF